MVQAVGGTNAYYAYTPAQGSTAVAPAGGAYAGAYQMDAYSGGSYGATSMAASGSISAIVGDPKAASRFSLFMINTPERLLKVGGGMGSVGRAFLNLLAGNVPLFTPSIQRAEIANNVRLWLSSSDLVRTGATPPQAILLQDVGIWKAQDLAVYQNPADQGVLAQRLAAAAGARGMVGMAPTLQQVGMWVQTAIQVPKYNY
ncbi:MAG: hypothetical protein CVV27_12120 [Candidatus Melainabacteria bacterium HGW-Melainabacteria-1]|nr:MAG: hypothetical protein CVV27_12120 [Candidatus Melainabacteria bacterium HGW-Melainabacteria-1]